MMRTKVEETFMGVETEAADPSCSVDWLFWKGM